MTEFKSEIGTTNSNLPRLAFSMKETAQMLGVAYITVFRLQKRGKLRSTSGLRHKMFSGAEIQRFLES